MNVAERVSVEDAASGKPSADAEHGNGNGDRRPTRSRACAWSWSYEMPTSQLQLHARLPRGEARLGERPRALPSIMALIVGDKAERTMNSR
jgi:hypothetical protein